MPAALDPTALFIFFGSALAALLALIEVIPVRAPAISWLYGGTLASISLLQGAVFWEQKAGGSIEHLAFALYLPAPFILLLGLALASEDFRPGLRHIGLFAPVFTIAVIQALLPEGFRELRLQLNRFAPFYSVVFVLPLMRTFSGVRQIIFRITVLLFVADTVAVSALFALNRPLWASCLVTSVVCLIALIRIKYPEILVQIRSEVATAKYARSKLAGLDVDRLAETLTALMVNDRVYARDDVTLAKLAAQLALTSHQLSELINRKFSLGFFAYINRYRVEEAKRLLSTGSQNVLEIAMQVGFNNKSSFNDAFSRFAGCTPIEFRKKNHVAK